MADSPKDEINVIREDLGKLRQDVAELTRALKDVAASRADDARAQVKAGVAEARERLKQQASQAGEQGREYYDAIEKQVSERPLTSLLISFGIGFVLAKLVDLGGRR
ncbi:DUF883 family protein [Acidihalobacter prosperus]|uniref:DUF883 domain-containing protein n=1 Tax=Acidihalobacter prosperus TaxID=160660 RepID=A0A1A6C8P8_9GAMM|nr:DUF883 family protein [Acidihalobacter prosperus]OBS10942.1 hypothetical protein Thpro_020658 [Acidihalobacter prosperus]